MPNLGPEPFLLPRFPRRPSSIALALVLGCTTMLAMACEAETANEVGRRGGAGAPEGDPMGESDGGSRGAGPRDGASSGTDYDPQAPIVTGPPVNAAGFAAVLPVMQRHCSECHHAGTPLNLEIGGDVATQDKILRTLQLGTMPPAPRAPVSSEDVAKIQAWRDGRAATVAPANVDPPNVAVGQIISAATLATYKAALPKVAYDRLAKILASPSTLFWDKTAMPGAYQDTVGDGTSLPFGARRNDTGKTLIVPEGKKLFSEDGSSWSFPFGHTAGADEATNAVILNFMSLPAEGGQLLPVAYRVETGTQQGFPITRWNWSFPKGTVIGEIILVKDGASLLTSEIRTRERFADKWATNAFRPFPTAKTLSAAIKARRPAWQGTPALAGLARSLENAGTLRAKRLDSPAFANLVRLEGYVDAPLGDFGDPALVRELLTTTPFVAAYGTAWKGAGTERAFGATGPAAGLSIVPVKMDTGLLEVRESTCTKCHDQGGYFIGDLVDQAVLYGDVWGVDRIFSFYPFDPTRIDASGSENRSVRPAFSGIVARHDAAKHPASTYSFYRPTK